MAHFGTSALSVPLIVRIFHLVPFIPWLPRAAPIRWNSSPPPDWALLQLDVATNQVNWSHVRLYMTERFSHPPTAFVQRQNTSLHEHVDRSQICDHILRMRPCPSFFDAYQPCKMFHPEFILQNDNPTLDTQDLALSCLST